MINLCRREPHSCGGFHFIFPSFLLLFDQTLYHSLCVHYVWRPGNIFVCLRQGKVITASLHNGLPGDCWRIYGTKTAWNSTPTSTADTRRRRGIRKGLEHERLHAMWSGRAEHWINKWLIVRGVCTGRRRCKNRDEKSASKVSQFVVEQWENTSWKWKHEALSATTDNAKA